MNLPRFPLRTSRAAVPLAALLLSLLLPASLAAQPPCISGLGTRAIAVGGPVTVRILPPGADFTSQISVLKLGGTVGDFHFPLGSSLDVGASVPAGSFAANTELQFFIDVDQTGYEFTTGPASRNLDGLAHAQVTQIDADTVRVQFEDFLGASDRDFDDVVFEVDGAHPQIYFAGLPTEPGELSKLGCDPAGNLVASPIQVGGAFGLQIPLGVSGGWKGDLSYDDSTALVRYSAKNLRGEEELGLSQIPLSGGISRLELAFPKFPRGLPLKVEIFKSGQSLGVTHVAPLNTPVPTYHPVDFSETPGPAAPKKKKKIKLELEGEIKQPDGTIIKVKKAKICIEITKTGVFDDLGSLEFDQLQFTLEPDDPIPFEPLSEVDVFAAGVAATTVEGQSLFRFGQRHIALGQTEFHPTATSLALTELGASGDDGVSIDLGSGVETFESSWKPLPLVGLSVAGTQIALSSRGRFEGEDDRDLGTLRLLQADGKVRVEADYTSVGSPTHRIVVLDHGTVVAEVPSHSGIVAHLTSWPSGAGKGSFALPDRTHRRTPCFSLPLPPNTWIDIPKGPKVLGDRVLVLAESAGSVGGVSRFDIRASGLAEIAIADEQVTLEPIPPVPAVCVPSATRLCLGDGKFAAEVTWRDAAGRLRASQAVPLTREAGYFRFTDPARPEVAVKLFDGRAINGHWWVYEGGLSRRAYRLTVIDLERGTRKVYEHPRGRFASRLDDRAFAASGGRRSANPPFDLGAGEISTAFESRVGGCTPSVSRLCLAAGRFEVEVVSRGGAGVPRTTANTVPLGDAAGYFFFSEAANAEVFVKALPKAEGGWAIVRGSLTKSPYELRVRDRATGEVRVLR